MITKNLIVRRAIIYQLIGYGILLFLVTGDEVFDFPHNVFGAAATPINWAECMIEATYILVLCVFTTYLLLVFLDRIKFLEGFVGICAHCKKMLNRNEWQTLERYLSEHSEVVLSHGLCPDCLAKYYGEYSADEVNIAQPTDKADV